MISTLEGHRPTMRCIMARFWNNENKNILKLSREITDQESKINGIEFLKNSWKLNDHVFTNFIPYSLFIMKLPRYAVSEERGL